MYTIYYIRSIATNNLLYVGLTKRFSNRKSHHRYTLRNGKHHIKAFQAHVEIYGIDDLNFQVYNTYESKIEGKKMEFLAIRSWRPLFNTIWNKSELPKGIKKLEMVK